MGSGNSTQKKLNASASGQDLPEIVSKGQPLEGKKVPDAVFRTRVRDDTLQPNPFKWKDVTTDDLFKGKKIVLLALPGAFTPTCSTTHLPGYDAKYEEFKKLGVDEVICLSVNDAFVMFQWGRNLGLKNVFLLPDGNGDFTKGMGMLVKKSNLGFGLRSWRYSMYVEDGVVLKQFIEEGFADDHPEDPFTVSDADTMLKFLSEGKEKRDKEAAEKEKPAAEEKAPEPVVEAKKEEQEEVKKEVEEVKKEEKKEEAKKEVEEVKEKQEAKKEDEKVLETEEKKEEKAEAEP